MNALSHFISFIVVVVYTLLILVISIVTYRQPLYHNNRTRLALVALVLLALMTLFLIVAQERSIIPVRRNYFSLFATIFLLTTAIHQLAFLFSHVKGRSWYIFRVILTVLAVALALLIVVVYVYSL